MFTKCAPKWGRELAREFPINADVVAGSRQRQLARRWACPRIGHPLRDGVRSHHYVGRSFLQPSQLIRDFDVRVKLNLITELVKTSGDRGGRPRLRGTTCKARVNNLKEAGAKEVHVLVSCPPQ
jgi:amidophosphoribosyltransferase